MFEKFVNIVGNLLYGEEDTSMKASINEMPNGRTGLYYNGGALIKTYARARDAKRGAERMGLTVLPSTVTVVA